MPRPAEQIEIKEPPIQELHKHRSCFKRSCLSGCLVLGILVVVFFIIVRFTAVPRVKQLKDVPEIVPSTVPIYDQSNIEKVTYVSAKERSKTLEVAAVIPKIILIPFYLSTEQYLPEDLKQVFGDANAESGWKRYVSLVREPIFPNADLVEIHWSEVEAQPDFLIEYYETELQKNGFTVAEVVNKDRIVEIRFADREGVTGRFYVNDQTPNERGTDSATLHVEIEP